MKVLLITQARLGSTRLPSKVLKEIAGKSLLQIHLERLSKTKEVTKILVATTDKAEDEKISDLVTNLNFSVYRGSEKDVLDRFYQGAKLYAPDLVVRVTSDCPLIDAELIDKIVQFAIHKRLDYCSNTLDPKYPDGQDIEVFTYAALEKSWQEAKQNSEREHVTPYIWKNSTFKGGVLFKSLNFSEGYEYGHLRMTVDEQADFEVISRVVKAIGVERNWLEYAQYLDTTNEVKSINDSILRNEGYTKSITKEKN